MKSFTDLEQSRKLVEILPLESADMHYSTWTILNEGEYILSPNQGETIGELQEDYGNQVIPAWSLAALLGVLPNENMLVKTTDGEYYCLAKDVMTKHYDNPIDACYEIILNLHELNLLLL